jgi:glycogen debranching enzyme
MNSLWRSAAYFKRTGDRELTVRFWGEDRKSAELDRSLRRSRRRRMERAQRQELRQEAVSLKERFDAAFWSEGISSDVLAHGLDRAKNKALAGQILTGLSDASIFFDSHRLPELFCGFRSG